VGRLTLLWGLVFVKLPIFHSSPGLVALLDGLCSSSLATVVIPHVFQSNTVAYGSHVVSILLHCIALMPQSVT